MAYSNGCNCSGNCGSTHGTGYARRNNNSYYRNNYAALNTVPGCTRYRNYPFYTGNCPNECGCYECGCMAGVSNQNNRCCYMGSNYRNSCENECCNDSTNCNNCCYNNCNNCNSCDNCGNCNNCGNNACCNNCNCCNNCENNNCCDNWNRCDACRECNQRCFCDCPVYGLFTANAPLSVTAGAAIPLVTTAVSNNDFTVSGGTVAVNRCGTYLATYTIHVPEGVDIDTNIVLNVNGVAQPSTLQNITAAGSYTGQTVFTANAGTTLSLVSSAATAITEPVGQNIVTLTITRIG